MDRTSHHTPTLLSIAAALLTVLVLAGCGGGDDGDGPTDPTNNTPVEFTSAGWAEFRAGRWPDAMANFEDALALNAAYGPARVGLGWTRLQMATSAAAMLTAAGEFDAAATAGETGADMYAGRAAARLGAGGASLTGAISDAQAALAADPSFTFAHRTSVTAADLHLIVAFARAAQGDLAGALAAGDQVTASGIVENQPQTWVVGATSYPTFASAVLAHLHAIAEVHAG